MPLRAAPWAVDATLTMRAGADRGDPFEEQVGQKERPEMVDGERRLVTVDGLGTLGQHETGVVDQHVEPRRLFQDLRGSLPHRGEVGQVEHDELHAGPHRRDAP